MSNVTLKEEGARFREILGILRRRELILGINPEKVRLIIEDLGPTYVKLGQIVSMHSNILPKEYCAELEKLRSKAAPLDTQIVKEILEQEYQKPLDEVFSEFSEKPLGSASMAQVHIAKLKTGQKVAVKVQRPGIYEKMEKDTAMLHRAAKVLKYNHKFDALNFDDLIDEMWKAAQEELNFHVEESNLDEFGENLKSLPYVVCPKAYHEYTTEHVIVMDFMEGFPFDDLEKIKAAGLTSDTLGRQLIDHYLKQVLDDGFFHADPHPGNVLILNDGRIAWIDMGMMGRLSKGDRNIMKSIVEGIAFHDTSLIKDSILSIGIIRGRIDHHKLYNDIDLVVTQYGSANLGSINLSDAINEIFDAMGRNHIGIPKNLMMLIRGFSTIEGVIAATAPELNILEIMSERIKESYWKGFDIKENVIQGGTHLLRSVHKMVEVPGTMADLIKMFARGQGRVNMELQATNGLAHMLTVLVRNLILGLIITGLLIGSALICTTDIQPKAAGIPWLAFVGFIAAAALVVLLIILYKKESKYEYD